MASHFGAIGFGVSTREELEALGVLAANVGAPHEAEGLLYLRWQPGAGVEVWAQAELDSKKIKGVTPYFTSGEAALEGTIEEVLASSKRAQDGSVVLLPRGDERRATMAGVQVVLPDFRLELPRLEKGARARFSVAAFAHAFEELEDEESLGGSGLALGMILPAPQGLAFAAGTVVKSERRTNPSGRRDFGWVLLEVQGGTIDLLLDPELRDEVPEPGQLIRGVFWLSGCLA